MNNNKIEFNSTDYLNHINTVFAEEISEVTDVNGKKIQETTLILTLTGNHNTLIKFAKISLELLYKDIHKQVDTHENTNNGSTTSYLND